MGFREVQDLNCDVVVALGGINKKTGKPNPAKIEGYYLGKREIEDRKKKSGKSYIYVFQTPKGSVGVWGKTDLDRKMLQVTAGHMTRVTQSGMVETQNGEMYKYKVETDPDNTIEVNLVDTTSEADSEPANLGGNTTDADDHDYVETDLNGDEEPLDVAPTPAYRSTTAKPTAKVTTPSSAQQAKVQALLNGTRKTT